MLKKIVVGGLSLALAGGLLLGSDAFSYLRTFGGQVREVVKSEISVEFELDRIRDEVDNLVPEIRRHMTIVAEQSVDVKDLERDLADKEASLGKQKDAIIALRSDLKVDAIRSPTALSRTAAVKSNRIWVIASNLSAQLKKA